MPPKRRAVPDRKALLDWWPTLTAPGFIALPPPAIGRQRPTEAAAEAREAFAAQGMPETSAFAYWLAPDEAAFNRSGSLLGPLSLHWGGDHAVVRAALGTGPAGFTIADGGPGGLFVFDLETARDADGLPLGRT